MIKYLNFDIENAEIIEQNNNSQFITAKIDAFSSGITRNDTICDVEALKKSAPTIYEKPILFTIDERFNDFHTHVDPDKTLISGFVVPDSAVFKGNGERTTLSVTAKIWSRYAEKFINIFKQDNTKRKKVSVEVELLDSEEQVDGLLRMKDWIFAGICVLGDLVTEASQGANIQLMSFAVENDEYKKVYELEFGSYEEKGVDFNIPDAVKKNAQLGLDLHKKYNKGSILSVAHAKHLTSNTETNSDKIRHASRYMLKRGSNQIAEENLSSNQLNFLLWGGEESVSWVGELSKKLDEIDNQHDSYFSEMLTFPYKSLKDANPALKGIDPPISLGQANAIAKQADAIGSDKEKNGWAIAISSFKKTHVVKDGHWVKKEDMSVKSKEELEKEQMAKEETFEEEKKETPEEEKKEEEKEKKEKPEEEKGEKPADEKKEEDKEKNMSLNSYLDAAVLLKMLEDETENYKGMVEEEFAKPEGEQNMAKVCEAMYCKMCKMSAANADMCGKMAKMEEENKAYMAENEELKKFKADEEQKEFTFAVDTTLKEIEERVEMPTSDREFLLEESKKFTLETIDGWKNLARAKAFEFAKKDAKEDSSERFALPWGNKDANVKKSLWKD